MARVANSIRLTVVSPVWLVSGALSRRSRFVEEMWPAERDVESILGGSKITGLGVIELCSLALKGGWGNRTAMRFLRP